MKNLVAILSLTMIGAVLGNAGAPGIGRAAASSAAPATVARTDDTSPKLVRFKAYLFNRDTGAFSPDVLARAGNNKPVELGNVLGGAFASDSTFVSIEIRAPAADIIAAGTRIRFRAIDTDELPFAAVKRTPQPKLLVDKIVQTRRVKAGASTFIGFWLPDTGCAPVKLSAEWVNIRNAAKLTDTLAFVCHE